MLPEAEPSLVDFVDLGQWSTTVDGTVSHALIQGLDGKVYGGTHAGHDSNAHLFSYKPDVGFTDLGQVPPDSPDIYVSAITVHSNGNLYTGTSDSGCLVKYDPNTGTMETVGNNVAGGSYINQLREGSGGKIYGTTASNGHLFSYDPDSGAVDDLGQVASGERALFGLAFDASGDCIFLTSSQSARGGTGSMYRYNLTTQETTSFGLLVPDARWASYNIVQAPDGYVYGGASTTTGEGHLWRFALDNPDTPPEDLGAVAGESSVDFLALGSDHKVYATTRPNGHLVMFDPADADAGIVDLGQIGPEAHNPIAVGLNDRLYLGVGDHLYIYAPEQVPVSIEEDEETYEEPWRYFRNHGYVKELYPDRSGKFYFRFWEEKSETAMQPTDNYYYVPPGHANYQASVDLLYRAAESQWQVCVSTEREPDEDGHAVVQYLYVPVPVPEDAPAFEEAEAYEAPWLYSYNHGYIAHLYPSSSGRFYFRFWEGRSETAMNSTYNYYFIPPDHANYQASVDLLYLAAESQWEVCVSTEQELDEDGYAEVQYLYVPVPLPEEAPVFVEEEAYEEPWLYSYNHGYIAHLYPSSSGRFYFRFWEGRSETAMNSTYNYYFIPPDHANYQASVDLLYLAAESQWEVCVSTEQELDEDGYAEVQYLYVPVPPPEEAPVFVEEEESEEPWNYSRNYGYIAHLYPSGSGRLYFDFWQEGSEMAMQPQPYYYVPLDHANYQASVDLLYLAAESQWQVGVTTEPELDEHDRAVVQDLYVPVPKPEGPLMFVPEQEGEPWQYFRNHGYIEHLYPSGSGRFYFDFWQFEESEFCEMAMLPTDNYYYVPLDHDNYQASVDLLYLAAESQWQVGATTEPELDERNRAVVQDLHVPIPAPTPTPGTLEPTPTPSTSPPPTPLPAQDGGQIIPEPISDPDTPAMSNPSVIATNDQCQVMVVYNAKQDGTIHLYSALNSGGSWQTSEVPLPADHDTWYSSDLHDLAAHGSQFALLLERGNDYYYALWSDGSWSTPQEIPSSYRSQRMNFDAEGNLIFFKHSDKEIIRLVGDQFESLTLPQQVLDPGSAQRVSIYRGRTGAIHIVGVVSCARLVPTIVSLPASADAMQTENWVFNPSSSSDYSTVVGSSHRQLVVDWPNQTVWGGWEDEDTLYVAHAPLGATTEAEWQSSEIALPEGFEIHDYRLASSGAGAVGVVYIMINWDLDPTEWRLVFRWLLPTGVGEPINLVRPGTQTEAAQFTEIKKPNLAIGPDGTAHVVAVAKKRGEGLDGVWRVYYARVAGGAVVASEPGVTGGAEQVDVVQCEYEVAEEEGAKPDLVATIELGGQPTVRDGKTIHRHRSSVHYVHFDVTITNNGAEYYGDLWADVIADGALWHYHFPDDSNGMQQMLERGESKRLIGSLEYEFRPQEGWEPPEEEVTYPYHFSVKMYSGLGLKNITVTVDPDNLIDEENEDNNVAELQYEVSDGRTSEDRIEVDLADGTKRNVGYNDLAILTTELFANTPTAPHVGLVQRPTEARVIVGNPRHARFFLNVPVVVLFDGEEIFHQVIPLVDDDPPLDEYQEEWLDLTNAIPSPYETEDFAAAFTVPVDLTNVTVGEHTLTFMVDPDDKFADLDRTNNNYSTTFKVREPGGTLKITVQDSDNGTALSKARVLLPGLFWGKCDENGYIEIPDVPPREYAAEELWAYRHWPEPRYGEQRVGDNFTIENNQEEQVTINLELPAHVIVEVLDEETGEAITESPNVVLDHLEETWTGRQVYAYARPIVQGDEVHFMDIPPGECNFTAGAYAYETVTTRIDVRRYVNGTCHVNITLPHAPRGTIAGTVANFDGDQIKDVKVWLNGAPRSAETDNEGHYEITEVEASRNYQVISYKPSYESARNMSGNVSEGVTQTVDLKMCEITQKSKSLSFDAITWAMLESYPGFKIGKGSSKSVKVSAEYGKFHATLGMLYHAVQGQDEVVVDEIVAGIQGDVFWQEDVTYEYSLLDLISAGAGKAAGGVVGQIWGKIAGKIATKAAAMLVKSTKPINAVYDYFHGDIDYQQLHDGEVVGSFTTHTGDEYQSATLIDIPSLPFSPGMYGGQTVVRCDIVEVGVTDADGYTNTIMESRRRFYSPKMAIYHVGEEMNQTELENLEVTFYITVLNQNLKPGPLYANSKNVLIWKPMKDKGLRFEPRLYNPLPD